MLKKEENMVPIKNKMTEIRRRREGAIMHNYYNNCEQSSPLYAVYGVSTIVFWENDKGVIRGYFYSSNEEELTKMIAFFPKGCVIDYLTKVKDEHKKLFRESGLHFLYELHRLSFAKTTEEEKIKIEEKRKLIHESLYKPENCRCAELSDIDILYKKLYEVFDERESHLPTLSELKEYIENKWVAVYYEDNILKGFQMFTVENGQFYGYQIWNGTGPECYYTMVQETNKLYDNYLKRINFFQDNPQKKIKPSYCWVNVKNRKSYRLSLFWGQKFDGLYDYVYEK